MDIMGARQLLPLILTLIPRRGGVARSAGVVAVDFCGFFA
jgi:hypothetical protein